jgi:Arc/MetJ family transcription regulator
VGRNRPNSDDQTLAQAASAERSKVPSVWFDMLYPYGTVRCMKKTLHIDEKTLREAKEACGASTDTETVRLGLEMLIRHAAYQRLRKLRGTEKSAVDVPRRKTEAGKKRTAA